MKPTVVMNYLLQTNIKYLEKYPTKWWQIVRKNRQLFSVVLTVGNSVAQDLFLLAKNLMKENK